MAPCLAMLGSTLAPGGLYLLPAPWNQLYVVAQVVLWLAACVFLLWAAAAGQRRRRRSNRAKPATRKKVKSPGALSRVGLTAQKPEPMGVSGLVTGASWRPTDIGASATVAASGGKTA